MDDDDIEMWKDCPTLKGYQVSSHGRVRGTYTHEIVDQRLNSKGYPYMQVFNPIQQVNETFLVYHLVIRAFIGERPEGCPIIRHLDDVKTNSRPDNLFYGTYSENSKDEVRNGRVKNPVRPKVKLTRDQIVEIKRHVLTNGKMMYADRCRFAERFNVHPDTVKNVANGKSWGHIKPVIPEDGRQ